MREIKLKGYFEADDVRAIGKGKKPIESHIVRYPPKPGPICEYISLIDQNGQDIYTGDLVLIEDSLIHKQFRIIFSQEHLAYCFQTEDQERSVYTWKEIKGIFDNNFTVTKTGNIFKQGG